MLHARIAPIGANWAFVGDCLGKVNACSLKAVDTGKNLGPDDASQRFIAWIGPAIVNVARGDRGDHTLVVQCDACVTKSAFVAMSAGGHVLGARFNPLDGTPPGLLRSQRTYSHLRVAGDLDAEAAADIEGLHPNPVDLHLQMRRQELDGERRKRIVAPVMNVLVFRVPLGNDDIVFERSTRKT